MSYYSAYYTCSFFQRKELPFMAFFCIPILLVSVYTYSYIQYLVATYICDWIYKRGLLQASYFATYKVQLHIRSYGSATVLLKSKLTLAHVSLVSTQNLNKITRVHKCDSWTRTLDACVGIHRMLKHSIKPCMNSW